HDIADRSPLLIKTKAPSRYGHADDLAIVSAIAPGEEFVNANLFYSKTAIASPAEIWKVNLPGNVAIDSVSEQVTHMNDAVLSKIDMQPLESFTFKGANNEEVQGFMVKPPGFDPTKKYPLKFLIHGGPQGAWGNEWTYRWNAELFVANGYVVVMINFHGSTGYGQKFTD